MTMGFVNTTSTPTLMKMFEKGTLGLGQLITHGEFICYCFPNPLAPYIPSSSSRFSRPDTSHPLLKADMTNAEFNLQREGEKAYSTFAAAAEHKALKMIITTE
jgi:hypothetical protein